jgi:hypothetical protein
MEERQVSPSPLAAYLANGNVGAFANCVNSTPLGTNVNGGLLSAAGLPQNFFVTNPQFACVYLTGNNADFATIDSSIDDANFGRFTAAGSNNNRIIVLGGRVNW